MPTPGDWTWFYPFRSWGITQDMVDDSWTPDNPDAYWPEMSLLSKNFPAQTRYLQNAAYVRLKSLTISYDLPASVLENIRIKDAKIYVAGQNLWEYSQIRKPLDPEYVFSNNVDYPLLRTFSIGAIINL